MIKMITYIVRKTTYDSARPYEVVCVQTNRIDNRYPTMKQALRRVSALKAKA